MITNERQYRITKAQLKRFEEDLAAQDARKPGTDVDARIKMVMSDALASEVDVLRGQLRHYERLRDGEITQRKITSLRELPVALIEARIAARLTQRALAKSLGLAEQQVQRWEANEYTGVNLERLQSIADALGIRIQETIIYKPAA